LASTGFSQDNDALGRRLAQAEIVLLGFSNFSTPESLSHCNTAHARLPPEANRSAHDLSLD